MLPLVDKLATPDEILAQIRRMPFADREYVEAELMRDAYESGRVAEPPEVLEEIVRRAKAALADPEDGLSLEQSIERAHAVVRDARRRRS